MRQMRQENIQKLTIILERKLPIAEIGRTQIAREIGRMAEKILALIRHKAYS